MRPGDALRAFVLPLGGEWREQGSSGSCCLSQVREHDERNKQYWPHSGRADVERTIGAREAIYGSVAPRGCRAYLGFQVYMVVYIEGALRCQTGGHPNRELACERIVGANGVDPPRLADVTTLPRRNATYSGKFCSSGGTTSSPTSARVLQISAAWLSSRNGVRLNSAMVSWRTLICSCVNSSPLKCAHAEYIRAIELLRPCPMSGIRNASARAIRTLWIA